jgi:hypothetical protein
MNQQKGQTKVTVVTGSSTGNRFKTSLLLARNSFMLTLQ